MLNNNIRLRVSSLTYALRGDVERWPKLTFSALVKHSAMHNEIFAKAKRHHKQNSQLLPSDMVKAARWYTDTFNYNAEAMKGLRFHLHKRRPWHLRKLEKIKEFNEHWGVRGHV